MSNLLWVIELLKVASCGTSKFQIWRRNISSSFVLYDVVYDEYFRDPQFFRVPSVSFGADHPACLSGDGGPSATPGQHRPDPEVPGPRDRFLQCVQGGGGGGQDRTLRGSATPASRLYRSRQWGRLTVPTRTGKVPPFHVKVLTLERKVDSVHKLCT